MNKLANSLQQGKACVPFLTCGDPDLATTAALIKSLSQGGADLLILGLPFSDPTAETPSIQSASLRSLANGTTTDTFFTFLRHLRAELTIPLVVMTYANVVFSYGCDRFLATCAELGLAGLLLPDVPWEEKAEFASVCAKYDLVLISTLAPASDTRMAKIAQEAQGFLYLEPALEVSATGEELLAPLAAMLKVIRAQTTIPCLLGCGLTTPAQVRTLSSATDGIIVGSALARLIEQHGTNSPQLVEHYLQTLKLALSEG